MELSYDDDGTPILTYPGHRLAGASGELPAALELPAERVLIDLERVTWAYPSGLLLVCGIIDQLLAAGVDSIEVTGPTSGDCRTYCSRMHLPRQFDGEPVRFRDIRYAVSEAPRSGLLEVRSVVVENDDQVIDRAEECLGIILTRRDDLKSRGEELFEALEELLSNVQVHSRRNTARVAVQSYMGKHVHLAVGDCGRGIPAALRNQREDNPTDAELVEWATQAHVSSRRGRGGMGLTRMRHLILDADGTMQIRSGEGLFHLEGGETQVLDCPYYAGTIVNLRF